MPAYLYVFVCVCVCVRTIPIYMTHTHTHTKINHEVPWPDELIFFLYLHQFERSTRSIAQPLCLLHPMIVDMLCMYVLYVCVACIHLVIVVMLCMYVL